MKKDNTQDAGYWTKDRCREIASGFSNTTAFRKAKPAQFNSSVDGHSVTLSEYSTQTIQIS